MFEPLDVCDDDPDAYSRFDMSLGVIESILLKKLRTNNNNEMVIYFINL
jgi:hypothetical protein